MSTNAQIQNMENANPSMKIAEFAADYIALKAQAAALEAQTGLKIVAVAWQGDRTVAQLNSMTGGGPFPVAGDAYTAASAGTPTAGSSDALTIGDLVEYDGTSWKKLLDSNAASVVPAGTVVLVGNGTLQAPLVEGTDENKIATFNGITNTPALVVPVDGTVRLVTSGSIFAGTFRVYDTTNGWTSTLDSYSRAAASRNKIPDATRTVSGAIDALDDAMPKDVMTYLAAAADRVENTVTPTEFATKVNTDANELAAGDELHAEFEVLVVSGNGTNELQLDLQMGGSSVLEVASFDVTNGGGDSISLEAVVKVGLGGASGFAAIRVRAVRTLASGTTVAYEANYFQAFDTTAAMEIDVLATWSAAHADNKADMRLVRKSRRLAKAVT